MRKVKSKEALEKYFKEIGAIKNDYNNWYHPDWEINFTLGMWDYCGERKPEAYEWLDEWLEPEVTERVKTEQEVVDDFGKDWINVIIDAQPESIWTSEHLKKSIEKNWILHDVFGTDRAKYSTELMGYISTMLITDKTLPENSGLIIPEHHITTSHTIPHNSTGWTDKHYNFLYKLTEQEKASGEIKVDPYWVALQWGLGAKDSSGILTHQLKTISRFGDKNPIEREITALEAQIKRLKELYVKGEE